MSLRFIPLLLLVMPMSSASRAATPAAVVPDDELVGLWGSETISGPAVRGSLTLVHHGERWVARIAGFEVEGTGAHDTLRLALPAGQGELRVRVGGEDATIHGFWVQPAGRLLSVPYVTPVALARVAAGVWRGTVTPLDDRWSLYLLLRREPDGSLRGVFRNPEANWRGPLGSSYRVTRDHETLRFVDPDSGQEQLTVHYDSAAHQIGMDFGYPVVLTRRGRDEAVGYYPRTPAPAVRYRAPTPIGDGWPTSDAAAVGLDPDTLATLVQRLATGDPVAPRAPLVHSLLVARHGKLVLDEYFFGFDESRPHDLRSASKTFVSVLLGAAMRRGAKLDVSTPAFALFPKTEALLAAEPRRRAITVGHLLTYSSGLACDEFDDNSPGGEGTMQTQRQQPDWQRYFLELPVLHDPGSVYAYCSGGTNLAAGAIARATGAWLPAFFDETLARPLQMKHYAVNLTPTGEMYGGGGMYLRPRDFLKFGQLYLNGGTWNGRRLVSEDWVRRSTAHQIDAPNGGSDGFAWHRNTLTSNGHAYQEYEANGNGGQLLIVLPELDIVVVFTAGNYNSYLVWRKFRDELVPQFIIAAVRDRMR